jgi:hypothetical protein
LGQLPGTQKTTQPAGTEKAHGFQIQDQMRRPELISEAAIVVSSGYFPSCADSKTGNQGIREG